MNPTTLFNSLHQRFLIWNEGPLHIAGVNPRQWPFWLAHFRDQGHILFKSSQILVCPDSPTAQDIFLSLSKYFPNETLYFPGREAIPYDNIYPSERDIHQQFNTLSKMALQNQSWLVVTTIEGAQLKTPPPSFFLENHFSLEVSDIIPPLELAKKLVELGYSATTTVEEPGTFSHKGEVFDIFPLPGTPVRIYYFDDMIEEIFPINLSDNSTLRKSPKQKISLCPSPHILGQIPYSTNFKSSLPYPTPGHRARYQHRRDIFDSLNQGRLFESYPLLLPLFFQKSCSLLEYGEDPLITFIDSQRCKEYSDNLWEELHYRYKEQWENSQSECIAPEPEKLYYNPFQKNDRALCIDHFDVYKELSSSPTNSFELSLESVSHYLKENLMADSRDVQKIILFLIKEFQHYGKVVFSSSDSGAIKKFNYLLELFDPQRILQRKISYHSFPLENGFFFPSEKTLVLAKKDILFQKEDHSPQEFSPPPQLDIFAEQMATLKERDYVIHSQYGLGRYLGLESLDCGHTNPTEFMAILYDKDDKVYVPVYRFDLVQKYAGSDSQLQLATLRNQQFSTLKKKAQKSAQKLAFDLLELQAQRETSQSFPFSGLDENYREFEASFPFQETRDQLQAIDHVLTDMQKLRPMDRLVCGDVGFGKTEVAVRASFKAVSDNKQVAILVPTTILALQHYVNFTERFKSFPIKIEFLSRFKSTKESKMIVEKLGSGNIDIIIGTHKLLSKDIKFFDLGLVIVDEEQRFGVNHKEKLKLLKADVDFLTLTATPLPRTLQMAFMGLRDISLIQTPPPRRQSIKSYIIKEDAKTIQNAINRELKRGGQVFVVHNRVRDIEYYKETIAKLVPNAKILIAHGQLPERELEKRITAFYSKEYQILISTTIIENGIDMPNVNTMIVNRADRYGLSQLHQLRGRIGRSDRKAYAYFILPDNRKLSETTLQRLKALQTYAEVGEGFGIASSDLEIRGSGDILGAKQSGHIEAVGLELYTQLLQNAIEEIKGEKVAVQQDIEINIPFSTFIPKSYIKNDSERLKQYKRVSNAKDLEQLKGLYRNLEDIYGPFPQELNTLFTILECRLVMRNTGLKYLGATRNNINLRFDENTLKDNPSLADNIVDTFLNQLKSCQISPNYSVTYATSDHITPDYLLKFCQDIAQKIVSP